ncbi:MAG: hypothetical protein IJE97_04050 [Thermoguttaceae bacterium]|nr:hypothetical protein [Thermoguttaceae bacterium]MBQ7111874.1 hypothetical protein [Thermoguttaceae bacterium]
MAIKQTARRNRLGVLAVAAISALCVGCGSNVKFGGKVVFSDDKSPVTSGVVIFEKPGYMARGALDENGRYDLGGEKIGGGLEKGTYKVYISGAVVAKILETEFDDAGNPTGVVVPDDLPPGAQVIGDRLVTPTIAPEFCDAKTTPLTVEVGGSEKGFDFEVDRN